MQLPARDMYKLPIVSNLASLSCHSFVVKVRPRTATSRSRSDARTRPVSAPSKRVKETNRRSRSAGSINQPLVLVPSLGNVTSTTVVNEISRAELEARATLRQNTRRPRESRPTVTFDRAGPSSAYYHCQYAREGSTPGRGRKTTTAVPREVDMHRCNLEQFGYAVVTPVKASGAAWCQRAARATPLTPAENRNSGCIGTADGSNNRSDYHDGPGYEGSGGQALDRDQYLDGYNMDRAEHGAGQQREHQQGRSDISVRCVALHSAAYPQQLTTVVQQQHS